MKAIKVLTENFLLIVIGLYVFGLVAFMFWPVNERFEYAEKEQVCPTAELSRAVIECAQAANPMSDEEGEDLVAQCEETMRRTYCEWRDVGVRVCTTSLRIAMPSCVVDRSRRL